MSGDPFVQFLEVADIAGSAFVNFPAGQDSVSASGWSAAIVLPLSRALHAPCRLLFDEGQLHSLLFFIRLLGFTADFIQDPVMNKECSFMPTAAI